MGRVTSKADGKPVRAIVVYQNFQTKSHGYVIANANGLYAFPALLPGHYSVRADAKGFQPALRSDIELTVGARVEVNFALEAQESSATQLVVRVTNKVTGLPIPKALCLAQSNPDTGYQTYLLTNDQGLCAFTTLPPAIYIVRADGGPNFKPEEGLAGSRGEIRLALQPIRPAGPAPIKCTPLAEPDIILLIKGGVHEARILEFIGSCGVGFSFDAAVEQRLKTAGATDSIIEILRPPKITSSGGPNLWALVIGISEFKNFKSDQQLEFADKDAEAFVKFIRSPRGRGFPESNVKLLLNQEATLASLKRYLGIWLYRNAKPNDTVYIFIATHGIVDNETKAAYLVTSDTDPGDLYTTALPMSDLSAIITNRLGKAGRIVLFADANRSGKLGSGIHGSMQEAAGKRKELIGLMASRSTEFSQEGKQFCEGHGAFTCLLLKGLEGAADKDMDKTVTLSELIDYLNEQVRKATTNQQHFTNFGSFENDVPLAYVDKPGPGDPAFSATRTERELKEAIALRPDDPQAYNMLGGLYQTRGDLRAAEAQFRKAIEVRPNFLEPRINLAQLLVDRNRKEEAERVLREALQVDSRNADAHRALGTLLLERGSLVDAEREFTSLLQLNPSDARTFVLLGDVYFGLKRLQEAANYYRQALQLTNDPALQREVERKLR